MHHIRPHYFAAPTHVEWQRAVDMLRNGGDKKPIAHDILLAWAHMRYAETYGMMQVHEETDSSPGATPPRTTPLAHGCRRRACY